MLHGMRRPGAATDDATNQAVLVRGWVRARFSLADEAVVLVTELTCTVPGCPPVETVIAFWEDGERRYRIKIFKPLAAVSRDDLPPGWLKSGLIDDGDDVCGCCG